MKKEKKTKLALSRETLQSLESEELGRIEGGAGPTDLSLCRSCGNTTCCPTSLC